MAIDMLLDAPAVAGTIQLTDYKEITEVLCSKSFVQGAYRDSGASIMRDTLPMLDGELHHKRRRLLAQLFNDDAVLAYRREHLFPVVEHCLNEVAQASRDPDGFVRADLVLLIQRCLYRLAAAIAGVDGLESADATDRFIVHVRTIVAGFAVEWARDDQTATLRRAEDAQQAFKREFFLPSCERRARLLERDSELPARDVLTLILKNRDSAWAGDNELPMREISLFLTAASQTTANGFVSLILRLEDWFARHDVDRQALVADPDFLWRAAYESLRLTVAAPARIRTATADVLLSSGRKIRAGERVAMLFVPANSECGRFGADADAFNPMREVHGVGAHWGLAFGAGAHTCPGRPVVTGTRNVSGKVEVEGTMAAISRRFYAAGMELDPDHPPVADDATHYEQYASIPVRFTKFDSRDGNTSHS